MPNAPRTLPLPPHCSSCQLLLRQLRCCSSLSLATTDWVPHQRLPTRLPTARRLRAHLAAPPLAAHHCHPPDPFPALPAATYINCTMSVDDNNSAKVIYK